MVVRLHHKGYDLKHVSNYGNIQLKKTSMQIIDYLFRQNTFTKYNEKSTKLMEFFHFS